MSTAQIVLNKVKSMPPGRVFGYQDLPDYAKKPAAVVKAVSRLVQDKQLMRLSKGKFYIPKQGVLGPRKPSDSELIRSFLYDGKRLRGYITGLALFNRLGLTTQMPNTITVAWDGARLEKDFGTIRIKTVSTRAPIKERDVSLLQYLDVLRDIKTIPDADINQSLKIVGRAIRKLDSKSNKRLIDLAVQYYSPQARALLGLLLSGLGLSDSKKLKDSLNPTTSYKLPLDRKQWSRASEWNIQS